MSGSWVLAVALLLTLFARSDIGRNEPTTYIKYVRVMGLAVALLLTLFARSDVVEKGPIGCVDRQSIQSTYI